MLNCTRGVCGFGESPCAEAMSDLPVLIGGGCVRGCVAARLGLSYVGIDLSETQLDENRRQAVAMRAVAEGALQAETQDVLMVSYLASITQAQLAITSKIHESF